MIAPHPVSPQEPDSRLLAYLTHDEGVPRVVRASVTFFEFFASTLYPLLETRRNSLDAMYAAGLGRPADDPVRLPAVLAFQFVLRLPDARAAEAMQYDLRWRLALHMGERDSTFHPSLLPRFRDRLLKHDAAKFAFDAVLDLLVKEGWVPRRSKQRLDSTHVCALVSKMSRLECVRETLRLALEALERQDALPQTLSECWASYVETKIDPRADVTALKAKMLQAGKDMKTVLAWLDQQPAPVRDTPSAKLLKRVFAENFDLDESGALRAMRAQPTGSVHNPHDPDAQWSSKSTTKDKTWVGTKVQVSETVQDEPRRRGEPTRSFITAMVTQDAPASDKPGMAEVLAEQKESGLEPPTDLYVDGAYVSGPALKQALDEGRQLHGPAPASPNRGQIFPIESFNVQVAERGATCPAGHRSTNFSRLQETSTGKITHRIEWNQALCGSCSMRDRCVGQNQTHRAITVGEHHDLLQARRIEMLTEAFKADMRRRNGIEGTQSELVRAHGLRHSRYRGKAKARLQNYLIGAACNIRRLFRRLTWEASQGNGIDGLVAPAIMG